MCVRFSAAAPVTSTSGAPPYGTLWLYAAVTTSYVVASALLGRIRTTAG